MHKSFFLACACSLALTGGCSNEDPPTVVDTDASSAGSGGSGGSAGSVDGGAPPPIDSTDADPESFYPVVDGASWTYLHTGGSAPWDEDVTLDAVEFEGQPSFLLADTPGPSMTRTDSVLQREGSVVRRVHKTTWIVDQVQSTVAYDPGFARFDYAWVGMPPGHEETLTYQRTEQDASGVIVRDAPREHTFTVEAFGEQVEVPAGSFDDCVRIRRERVRQPGVPIAEGDVKLFWYCPGIGKTREEDELFGKIEELTGCDVPGGSCP